MNGIDKYFRQKISDYTKFVKALKEHDYNDLQVGQQLTLAVKLFAKRNRYTVVGYIEYINQDYIVLKLNNYRTTYMYHDFVEKRIIIKEVA